MREIEDEKLETVHKRTVESPYKLHIASLVILAMLMYLPFCMDKMDLFNHNEVPQLLYPFTILTSGLVQKSFHFFYISCFSLFLLPVAFLIILTSIFNKKITQNAVIISAFVAVTFYLATAISGMMTFANTIRWFQSLSILVYAAFFTVLPFFHLKIAFFHIFSIRA